MPTALAAGIGFVAVRNNKLRSDERETRQENRFYKMRNEADSSRILALKKANVEIADHAKTMEDLAMIDPLTGLYNRRAFQDTFDRLQATRNRAGGEENRRYTLMILDLDNLKSINDGEVKGGHEAGDSALCVLADSMSSRVRKEDMVARIGGDEFAILLQHAPMESAPMVAEDIKSLLDQAETGLTFSGGIAEIGLNETFEECYKRADLALYEAKRLGRDRVEPAA